MYVCSYICVYTRACMRTHTPFFSTSILREDLCLGALQVSFHAPALEYIKTECLLGQNFKLRTFGVRNIWHKTFSLSDIILLETQLSGLKNPFRSLWSRAYFFSSGNSTAELLKISRNPFAVLRCWFLSFLVRDGCTQVDLSPSLVYKKGWGAESTLYHIPQMGMRCCQLVHQLLQVILSYRDV